MASNFFNRYIDGSLSNISFGDIHNQLNSHPGRDEAKTNLSMESMRAEQWDLVQTVNQNNDSEENVKLSNFRNSFCWGFSFQLYNEADTTYDDDDDCAMKITNWHGSSTMRFRENDPVGGWIEYDDNHTWTHDGWGTWNAGDVKRFRVEPTGTDSDGTFFMTFRVAPQLGTTNAIRVVGSAETYMTAGTPGPYAYIMHWGSDGQDEGYV